MRILKSRFLVRPISGALICAIVAYIVYLAVSRDYAPTARNIGPAEVAAFGAFLGFLLGFLSSMRR